VVPDLDVAPLELLPFLSDSGHKDFAPTELRYRRLAFKIGGALDRLRT